MDVQCLNHDATVTVPNRGKAWTTGSHPQDFCPKCKAIAAGKAETITGDRLDVPKAKPTRKATTTGTKAASKKPAKKKVA